MGLEKCHLLFGCEIMKFFSTGLLLLIVFGSLEGSTIPHKRTVRALNATIQTHFNGTIQRTNPCTNKEVERSSYRGCHEFHHHSEESSWSDYSRKCATLISNFFQAISNLVTFKDRQSGTFDLNINTKVSHKTDGVCADTKKPICPTPTIITESTDCEVLPSTGCDDLPGKDTHIKGSEICSLEEAVKADEQKEEICSTDSESSVNEEPQTAGSSSISENDKCLDVSYMGEKIPEPSNKVTPELQPTPEVISPEIKSQSEEFQPETIPTYDNYPSSDQFSETPNIESSVSNTYDDKSAPITVKPDTTVPSSQAPSIVITSAPKEDLYIDVSETPQQSTGTDSSSQQTPSDSKDYLSNYESQTGEEKTEIQHSSSAPQPENSKAKVVPEGDDQSIEFSDKIALFNVHDSQPEYLPTFSPSAQNCYSDTTTPSNIEIKSDYDVQDIPINTQPTFSPQYQSDSYDEQIQTSQAVTFAPVQPQPQDHIASSDLPTSSPPKDEGLLEFSDQLAVFNVRQPQPESPSSSSLLNEPTSIQPPALPESHPENYVNYEDGLVSNQIPTSITPPRGDQTSVEFSDQLAVYNVRQPYFEPTSILPISSEAQPDNYSSYEDETESNESTASSSPSTNVEPSIEFSDQLAVYNIRTPTTTYPPSSVSYVESSSTQPSVSSETQPANYVNYEDETVEKQSPTLPSSEEPSIEFSDQLAVYNVREPLPGTTTPYPLVQSSIQPSSSQSDNYVNYENDFVPNQIPSTSSPQHGEEQYVEYSDQLAVYSVRESLPTTTASSPAVDEYIPSSFGTTLSPSFSSYELDDSQETEVEPQPTFAPNFEEETYNFQPVTGQPQPSNEPNTDYYGDYNKQTVSNLMPSFTTPAGNLYPIMPSRDYIANISPESPSSDYSSIQDIPGFVSTSLPSSSDNTGSFNNFELQYDSQPTSTLLPLEAQNQEVFSDQVSNIREPQSDSSVSDGRISDMVTGIYPSTESDSSVSYNDGSLLTDSEPIIPTESQPETSITNEYPASSSNQPSQNNYEIYDEQSSASENEAPVTSANEPLTYQQSPIDVSTTSPSSTEPKNFGIYDDSMLSTEPQGTYPPKIENESFANYEDNDTSTAGQASVSIEPLPNNDSSEEEPTSSEEGSSSQEEQDGNVTVSDDQGLLPLSPNTFRPTVQIETTVNYADQTPFRPIRLSSSIEPLQENSIIYDEGILRNETEPSVLGEEEANNSLIVSSELAKQNEGKEFDSSTTLAPELKFDTYYEETFNQPSSSDAPKINNYMIYEDDVQPSSPKFDLNTTTSNDYSTSFFPSTPSFSQEIITTPSTSEAMPVTYTDYEYSKTDFNSQTTFPPQTESVIYDDHSSQDQSLPQQHQSVDYAAYNNQIQPTPSPSPTDQEMIDISDQLSIYNVPETVLESSPTLSELFSSNMVTTTQPTIPSDGENFSPSVEPESYDEQRTTQPLPSKDLNLDTNVNYEDTISSSQVPTALPPTEVEPSLEYSDQLAVFNVGQPQPQSPSSSSLLNEPTSIQPPALPESHPENYVNYEDGLVSNQIPTSITPPRGDQTSVEFSDQLAVYNVRQPCFEPTSILPISSEAQPDNYSSYEDETESNESTVSSSPSTNIEPSIEFSDQLAVYNIRTPTTTYPPSSVSYVESSSTQPSVSSETQPANYGSYEDETESNESTSSSSPSTNFEPSLELSDEVATYNVNSPAQFTSPSPQLDENIPKVTSSTLPPSFAFDQPISPEVKPESEEDCEDDLVSNDVPTTLSSPREEPSIEFSDELAIYNVRQPSTTPSPSSVNYVESTSTQPSVAPESQPDNYVSYEDETVSNQIPSTSSPQPEDKQYLEYSDQLAVYNVREPLPGTTTPYPLVQSSIQPSTSQSDNYVNYENDFVPNQIPTTSSPQHGEEQYVEYSDQLAVFNVREPLPTTTASSPAVDEYIPSSFGTTLPPLFSSNGIETYDDQSVENELQSTAAPEIYDESTSTSSTSFSPSEPLAENYVNYGNGEVSTSLPPSKSVEPFVEYSDQLSIYNVRQPEYYSSSPSPVSENLLTTIAPNLPSDDFGTNDNRAEYTGFQPPLSSESESQMYDEPSSLPASSVSQSDVYTNYDDKIVSNEFPTSSYPPHGDESSLEFTSQLASSSIAPSSSSSEEEPSLQYSDQISIYNTRQPYFETTPSSPLETENVSSGAMSVSTIMPFPSRDSFQAYDSTVTSSDYESTPSSQLIPESQVTYEDYTVQKEESPSTLPISNLTQSQAFSNPPPNYSAEPEFDYQATSPTQSQDNYISYEDQTDPKALTTFSPVKEVEPSLEYSDQLAIYNVREPVFESTTVPVVSENIPSRITTLSPSTLTDKLTSPQPSSSESQSDSYEDYEDKTVSNEFPTTLSTPVQTEPSVEYSDQLAAFNVLGPVIVPISAPVVDENIPSGDVTTPSPSSSLIVEQTSPQSSSSESESESNEDYQDETVSTPSPVTGVEPSLELSDELSIYNVHQRPSEMSTYSPLNENIPSRGVTTFAPSLPSDKFESYDYQPVGFESQPTFSPEVESQTYNQPALVPNTSSQPQDNYVSYENEAESNEPMTTLRPPLDVEYSDELAIYNIRSPYTPSSSPSPLLNENTEADTVSTFMPAPVYDEPTSAPSTSPAEQSDSYINYEDQLPPNSLPITPQMSYEPTTIGPLTSSQSQPEQYVNYEDERTSTPLPISTSSTSQVEPSVEYSDELAVYNVREPIFEPTSSPFVSENIPGSVVTTLSPSSSLSVETISVQPSSSESQSGSDEDYEEESNESPTTLSSPVQVEPSVEFSDQLDVYNVREPIFEPTSPPLVNENVLGTVVTTLSPFPSLSVEPISVQPSSSESQSGSDEDYEEESNESSTTLSSPVQVEPSVEFSDQLSIYNVRQPQYYSSSPSPLIENIPSGFQPTYPPQSESQIYDEPTSIPATSSESKTDEYLNYEEQTVPNQPPSSLSPPMQVEPSLEYSDQLAVYNVRQPEYSSSSPSPLNENYSNEMVTAPAPSLPSDGFGTYDSQVLYTDFQPTSSPQSDSQTYDEPTFIPVSSQSQPDNYVNYEDKMVSNQASSSLSPPVQFEPSVEYSDELTVNNVREPIFEPTSPPLVSENVLGTVVTTLSPSSSLIVEPISVQPSSSESQSGSDEDYEEESNESSTTLSTPVQVEPSVEFSDQLAVYNVREPISEPTFPPVVSENIPASVVTTLPPSSSLIVEQTSPQSSSSESESESNEDYQDETVSTPSPVTGVEPSLELSDELSIYNVRQRPSEMSTLSPFNNNVINNLMTTISPYLTFKESSPKNSINSISQTTSSPEYESDMYDEESSIQPSKSNEDDSQALSDETASKDSLPETLSNFADQTVLNVIQSPQSSDLSNQLNRKTEIESQKSSFITVQPNVETSVISDSTFGPSTGQEFDYQPTLSPDYDTSEETMTTPPSSPQSQDNYVVYEDQTVSNELTTSPVNEVKPSLEYSNQLAVDNVLLPETSSYSTSLPPYTDYEGATDIFSSPTTQYDQPRNTGEILISTSPQPQIVSYDYYSDQNQKPKESSTSPATTEIDTEITLTEVGPTFPPNFESQIFDNSDSIQHTSSSTQPDNYVDNDESVVSNQLPTFSSPQTDTQPSIELDELTTVYNVRKPYFEPTSIQPSFVPEPQPDNYDTYEDQVIVNAPSTPLTPSKVEYTVTQPTSAPEGETQMYDETTTSPATSSEPQPEQYVNYEDERTSTPLQISTSSTSQVEPSVEYSDELAVYNTREPIFEPTSPPLVSENIPATVVTTLLPSSSISVEPISVQPSSSESQSGSDEDYEEESNESPTTFSSPVQVEPSVEFSDQLAVYNVREPISESTSPPVVSENIPAILSPSSPLSVETISVQPSSSESQSGSDEDYEESNESSTTLSSPVQVEPSVEYSDQLSIYNVRQPQYYSSSPSPLIENIPSGFQPTYPPQSESQIYDEPTSIPATSSESKTDEYLNYEEQTVPNQHPSSLSPPVQVEPSVEYSDELTVNNVREPIFEPTSPPLVSENIPGSVVTTLLPSSSLSVEPISVQPSSSESQSGSDEDYEEESNESSTTLSTPVQVEPSVEFSDQLAVYNVREPIVEPTFPPVVSENIPASVVTSLPPSSSLIVEQTSPQSSSESELESNEDYQDETVSTPSPVIGVEPSLELSDELSIYNVRQRPSEMSTLSPFNNNVINNLMTTISPYFTSSSNDNEDPAFQSSVTSEPEQEVYDRPYSASSPSSESIPNNYVNSEDEITSDEYSTSSSPPTESQESWSSATPFEYQEPLSVYNVRQRPFDLSTSSPLIENFSDNVIATIVPSFPPNVLDSYDIQSDQNDEPQFSPKVESQNYDISTPIQNSSPSQPENYDDEIVSNDSSTTLSSPREEPSIEFSDELAIYNVHQPSTTPSPSSVNYVESISTQPSVAPESQPDNYVSYEDETVSNQIPSTSSPQPEDKQYLEYSDQLAVYNVREPLPGTTTPYPLVQSSIQPSTSQSDNYVNYENDFVPNQIPTTSSPQHGEEQYVEYSDQLAVYNVREPLPTTTTLSPLVENFIQPSSSPSDTDESYEDDVVSQPPSEKLMVAPSAVNEDVSSSVVNTQSSFDSQPISYDNYEDQFLTTIPPPQDITMTFSNNMVTTAAPSVSSGIYNTYDSNVEYTDPQRSVPTEFTAQMSYEPTTIGPLTSSQSQPEQYVNYEDERTSTPLPISTSSTNQEEPSVEYSDELAVYNTREPIFEPTSPPLVSENIPATVVTTLLPSSSLSVEPISVQPSSSESQSGSDEDYEEESNESSTTLSTPVQVDPSVEYSDQLSIYNVRQPQYYSSSPSPLIENVSSDFQPTYSPQSESQIYDEPTSIPATSSESKTDEYLNYEEQTVPNQHPSSLSPPVQVEPSVEYSDQLDVYNVREPIFEPTSPPLVSENIPGSVVTTLLPSSSLSVEPISVQPSSSESQSGSDEDYEEESNESPTTLSTPVQVEPSVEFSDQLDVYNVREPIVEPTSLPVFSENIASSIVTTLSPSSESQSEDYYQDESNESPNTSSIPVQVEPSVEFSDQLAIYNVRQPEQLSSPSPPTENFANDLVTTVKPSLGPGDFETYDSSVVYTDFQPTYLPQSVSQMYDEPTSSSEPQTDNYVNYEDKMASNIAVTSASPPVDVDIEYSDELSIYDVRQTSTASPLVSDIATAPLSSVPESDSASDVFTTPLPQNSVKSGQDNFYTYDDRTQSSESQTILSPETEIDYDEAPTSPKPQSPSSTQPLLETMVTTFQPLTESQINKTENKTTTPSKQQEVSTFPPLHPFIPLNQPSYSLPGESKLVSEQQDQVILNQVVNSPPVPSSELDSDKQSNNFSNLVKSQETRPIDGVENTQRDTPQPEPFALVPDQTNPSNEPGEEYVSCTCTRGNGRSAQHTLMCPFNPVLKGNMTAPSYYILISKLSGDSGNQSLPDEESFQVEKVYLGDGTPLNCTEERKTFLTSKYTPVPISSARTVKLPIRLNSA